ncbi:MAG TPA: large conductance mechanosensitive channel protein MscL [Nitriliruptorales bacterium]
MLQEFKDFINKGNFVDIAVAFVIGAAFGTVVSALTGRIVSPLIGMVFDLGDMEGIGQFSCQTVPGADGVGVQECAGSVGAFVQAGLNFLIVGFVMFLVVKAYNAFQARHAESEPTAEAPVEPDDVTLLREIRDLLRSR